MTEENNQINVQQNNKNIPNLKEELKSIDVYQHLRHNILNPKINCKKLFQMKYIIV